MGVLNSLTSYHLNFFLTFTIYLFLEKGEGREKERRSINVWLPLTCPLLGTCATTQVCAWTGIDPATLRLAGRHSIC